MSTSQDVRSRTAARAQQAQDGASIGTEVTATEQLDRPKQPTIYQLIEAQKSEIARALPKHMDADRMARIIVTCIRTTPKLLECTPASLLGALMMSAQTGLEPGPLGHAYLVPFWNNKLGSFEVTWIIGYKGIIDLARRSGQIESIEAREVCEKDHFEFEYGLEEKLVHKPSWGEDRGPIIGFYGIARFKDGGRYVTVMSKADVDAHRARSRAKDSGPWVTDYAAMGRKTVVRTMAPFLPLTIEAAGAMANDGAVRTDYQHGADMLLTSPEPLQISAPEPEAVAVAPEDPPGTDATTGEVPPQAAQTNPAGGDEPGFDQVRQQVAETGGWPETKQPPAGTDVEEPPYRDDEPPQA